MDEAVFRDSLASLHQRQLADALYGRGPLPSADTLTRYLVGQYGALSASDFKGVVGTYTALQTSGDLRLIEDERLRAALVAYAARIDGERDYFRLFYQQAFGDVSRLARALPFMRLYGNPTAVVAEANRFRYEQLRHSPDFNAVLFVLQAASTNRLQHLYGMPEETRDLPALLETHRAEGTKPPARDVAPGRVR